MEEPSSLLVARGARNPISVVSVKSQPSKLVSIRHQLSPDMTNLVSIAGSWLARRLASIECRNGQQ
jgi:hypothetical protein